MKSNQLKKMIEEAVNEILSAQYNSIDKVLNALIAGKITKSQAKKFIAGLNSPSSPSAEDWGSCGSGGSSIGSCGSGGGQSSYGGFGSGVSSRGC